MSNGKSFYMFKNYTYYLKHVGKINTRWSCSCVNSCPATFLLNQDGEMVTINDRHTHKPRNFLKLSNGTYVAIT